MKTSVAFTATALIIAATFDSAMGLAKYLDELPNGSSFSQELGHPDKDSSKYTDFATSFADAGHSWTADFCKATFPGASMTNGAAFGDPCCTWKKGGTADFTVTAFTTTPGKATVCASGSTSSTTASTAASTASSSAGSSTAPTTTDAPATTDAPTTTDAPAATDAPASTDAPATPSAPSAPSGGCGVKGSGGKGHGKGSYNFRH
ncbi:hypothetical protein PHMEG_0002735 [Phytophthora megakarya]|uniref:Temptin Cys/Cys disulfide domain-containing protein n=1 Tax=Phytophthora megakarya TaxID=4795 RepID=A0A225WY97_9STRA|nr:hypothetical protein PHMEG_0002735 [Phytophthora megakarya]